MHSEDTTAVDEIEPDERLRAAERRADELAAVARRQSDLVAELHEDNRRLRDGELREALAPLIRGLARILDDVDRMRQTRPDDADLAHIDSRVREVLHDAGALTLRPELGTPFDPRLHQASGSVPTNEPARDRTVAEVRREGLVDGPKLLRAAEVIVYRLDEETS